MRATMEVSSIVPTPTTVKLYLGVFSDKLISLFQSWYIFYLVSTPFIIVFDVLFSKNIVEKWFGQEDVGWTWHSLFCQCLLVVHLSISLVSGAWHVGAKQIYATGISFLMNCSDQKNQQYGLSSDKRLLKYTSLSYNLIFKITTIVYYIHFYFVNDKLILIN